MAEYIYDFKEPPDPEGYRGRLIRCKECKHSRTIPAKLCNTDGDWMVCNFHGRAIEEDNFCSWVERKEE